MLIASYWLEEICMLDKGEACRLPVTNRMFNLTAVVDFKRLDRVTADDFVLFLLVVSNAALKLL